MGSKYPTIPASGLGAPRITIAIGTMRATVRRCCPPSRNTGRAKVSPKRQRPSEIPSNIFTIFDSTSSVLLLSRTWSIATSSLRESIVCRLCSLILPNLSGSALQKKSISITSTISKPSATICPWQVPNLPGS